MQEPYAVAISYKGAHIDYAAALVRRLLDYLEPSQIFLFARRDDDPPASDRRSQNVSELHGIYAEAKVVAAFVDKDYGTTSGMAPEFGVLSARCESGEFDRFCVLCCNRPLPSTLESHWQVRGFPIFDLRKTAAANKRGWLLEVERAARAIITKCRRLGVKVHPHRRIRSLLDSATPPFVKRYLPLFADATWPSDREHAAIESTASLLGVFELVARELHVADELQGLGESLPSADSGKDELLMGFTGLKTRLVGFLSEFEVDDHQGDAIGLKIPVKLLKPDELQCRKSFEFYLRRRLGDDEASATRLLKLMDWLLFEVNLVRVRWKELRGAVTDFKEHCRMVAADLENAARGVLDERVADTKSNVARSTMTDLELLDGILRSCKFLLHREQPTGGVN